VIFSFERFVLPIFVGQQMDVFIDAQPHEVTAARGDGHRNSGALTDAFGGKKGDETDKIE
jgi:hypothetical protein